MKPYSFQDYELITYHKDNNKLFIFFFTLIIVGIIYTICIFRFNIYEKALLYTEDNNYYILIDINKSFNNNNSYLKIGDNEYKYEIIEDSDYSNINGTIYKAIHITIDKENIDKYTYVSYLRKSDTIMNMIFKYIRGGNL